MAQITTTLLLLIIGEQTVRLKLQDEAIVKLQEELELHRKVVAEANQASQAGTP